MHVHIKKLTLTAMFLAMGILLPFLFGQVPQIGSMLLPMHIPVFLCAFLCGWKNGISLAVILPLLRSLLFSRPTFYPDAIAIAAEMATYALVAGLLYANSRPKTLHTIYRALIVAMVFGRITRTLVQIALVGIFGSAPAFSVFLTSVILAGVPGIVLQLLLIPAVILLSERTLLLPQKEHNRESATASCEIANRNG